MNQQQRNESILKAVFVRGWYFVKLAGRAGGGYYSTEDDDRRGIPAEIPVDSSDMSPYPWNEECEERLGES